MSPSYLAALAAAPVTMAEQRRPRVTKGVKRSTAGSSKGLAQLDPLGTTRNRSLSVKNTKTEKSEINNTSQPAAAIPIPSPYDDRVTFTFGQSNASSANPLPAMISLSSDDSEKKIESSTRTAPVVATSADASSGTRSNTTAFESLTKEHIRPLLELNDQINALTSKENKINSTRIVVAGDQSHGKTSLLEALSGVDLPRGEGIQTRVPLILQLRAATFGDEYATIRLSSESDQAERISLGDIGAKVREYTENAAGSGKEIKDEPIELKIFRNDQDDLTLVDLPGITRVATSDQAGGDGRMLERTILDMCKKYMEREESILLNVVTAMVDIPTSASLMLSREVDPQGERTMLCITKVDQHKESGLTDKINAAIDMMKLDPELVFAVRNRSQQENDASMPLDEVRRLEKQELDRVSREDDVNYQLGVGSLSKALVKIQYESIVQTLPRARTAIYEQIKKLESRLDELGRPVGDATACRAKVMHCVEASISELQNEVMGRASVPISDEGGVRDGMSFEMSLAIDDFQTERKKSCKKNKDLLLRAKKELGGFEFELKIYPQYRYEDKENGSEGDDEPDNDVAGFLHITPPSETVVKSIIVTFSLSALAGNESFLFESTRCDFTDASTGWGTLRLLAQSEADAITGAVSFDVNVFVDKLVVTEKKEASNEKHTVLLCAQLNKLQDDFVSSMDRLLSNQYLFSTAFRKKLGHEVSGCRGGVGLPGAIAPHVPVNVLKSLRQKLPRVVETYRDGVQETCLEKVDNLVSRHFESKFYPKLVELVSDRCHNLFDQQASNLVSHHDLILEWEESVCSSNHYFMDTVQSIRSSLSASSDEDRPPYLKQLSDSKIKLMSNEDQRLVDMQIEIFAYWKLMKKRLADYIIMSTHSELVNKPINVMLKPLLLEVTMSRGDKELVKLLSPDAKIVRERAELSARLDRLVKARSSLEEYDQKMQLSWCG